MADLVHRRESLGSASDLPDHTYCGLPRAPHVTDDGSLVTCAVCRERMERQEPLPFWSVNPFRVEEKA